MFSPLGQHARYHPNAMFCDRERHRVAVARSYSTHAVMLPSSRWNAELGFRKSRGVGCTAYAPRRHHCEHGQGCCERHESGSVARSEVLVWARRSGPTPNTPCSPRKGVPSLTGLIYTLPAPPVQLPPILSPTLSDTLLSYFPTLTVQLPPILSPTLSDTLPPTVPPCPAAPYTYPHPLGHPHHHVQWRLRPRQQRQCRVRRSRSSFCETPQPARRATLAPAPVCRGKLQHLPKPTTYKRRSALPRQSQWGLREGRERRLESPFPADPSTRGASTPPTGPISAFCATPQLAMSGFPLTPQPASLFCYGSTRCPR